MLIANKIAKKKNSARQKIKIYEEFIDILNNMQNRNCKLFCNQTIAVYLVRHHS